MSKKHHTFYVEMESRDRGGAKVVKHYPRTCSCSIGKDHYGRDKKGKEKK